MLSIFSCAFCKGPNLLILKRHRLGCLWLKGDCPLERVGGSEQKASHPLTFFPGQILLSLLLPRQNRLRSEIEEALDMDLLTQEAEHGALNVPHLSKYILNTTALLCAPVRDEAVQKLESISDPAWLLRCEAWPLGGAAGRDAGSQPRPLPH